jgi:hypothetical protein
MNFDLSSDKYSAASNANGDLPLLEEVLQQLQLRTQFSVLKKVLDDENVPNDENAPYSADSKTVDSGMHCKVKNLYPGPGSGEFTTNWVEQYPDDLSPTSRDEKEFKSHALIIKNKKNTKGEFGMHIHSIKVQSPLLKSVLKQIFQDYPELSFSNFELEQVDFREPLWPFVHRWDEFEKAAQQKADVQAVKHTRLLYTIIRKELESDMSRYQDLTDHGLIDFDHLWALFRPGELILDVSQHGCGLWAHRFTIGHYEGMSPVFVVKSQYVDWNGKLFGIAKCEERIGYFKGTQPITDLTLYPMKFHPSPDQLRTNLVQRGRKFEALQGCKYKTYQGTSTIRTSGGFVERMVSQTSKASTTFANLEKVSGRIIIDCRAYLETVVSHNVLGKLPEPAFGDSEYVSSDLDLESCLDVLRDISPSGNPVEHEWTVPGQPSESIDLLRTSTQVLTIRSDVARLSEEHLLLCGPRLKGYCLSSKAWGMSSDHYSREMQFIDLIS